MSNMKKLIEVWEFGLYGPWIEASPDHWAEGLTGLHPSMNDRLLDWPIWTGSFGPINPTCPCYFLEPIRSFNW